MRQIKLVFSIVLLSLLLSSCYSYKNISKKETITKSFLSNLKPGKKYEFHLKIGGTQNIYITGVEGETINGYIYEDAKSITNRNNYSESTISGRVEYQTVYIKTTRSSYSDNFENIMRNVTKISVRKIDPIKITALVVVPAATLVGLWVMTQLPNF